MYRNVSFPVRKFNYSLDKVLDYIQIVKFVVL